MLRHDVGGLAFGQQRAIIGSDQFISKLHHRLAHTLQPRAYHDLFVSLPGVARVNSPVNREARV